MKTIKTPAVVVGTLAYSDRPLLIACAVVLIIVAEQLPQLIRALRK